MREDGTCPTCGRSVETPVPAKPAKPATPATPITAKNLDIRELAGGESASAPWHFKLLMVLLVLYLGWRLVDLFL